MFFFLLLSFSSSVLPAGLRLNAFTVVTVLRGPHYPCMVHNGNDVFTAAFLLLTLRLSILLWHPCTVWMTVQDSIVSSVLCACACVHCWCILYAGCTFLAMCMCVSLHACPAVITTNEWQFVYLVLPEARFHFGHTGVSLSPSNKQRGAGFLERSGAQTGKKKMAATMLIP